MVDHLRYTDHMLAAMALPFPDPRPYVQVADDIRAHIADGSLVPGEPIPSITTLRRVHGYSRDTISKGLRVLEAEGLLCRVRGLGYYVASEELAPLVEQPSRRGAAAAKARDHGGLRAASDSAVSWPRGS
jgi:DNA-binding GntR family transcriptional regulator